MEAGKGGGGVRDNRILKVLTRVFVTVAFYIFTQPPLEAYRKLCWFTSLGSTFIPRNVVHGALKWPKKNLSQQQQMACSSILLILILKSWKDRLSDFRLSNDVDKGRKFQKTGYIHA